MAETTIGDLKVGSLLEFGRYSVLQNASDPPRVVWIKMTPNCGFITKEVIDYLAFDAAEAYGSQYGYTGNPDFQQSNINQFLNSSASGGQWFAPQSEEDKPPENPRHVLGAWIGYNMHEGFLNHFEEYEIESIDGAIELPTYYHILGDGEERAQYFRKHGLRAHPTMDFIMHKRMGFGDTSWVPYYTTTRGGDKSIRYIDRTGGSCFGYPSTGSGIRPICHINKDTKVALTENGTYEVMESAMSFVPRDINLLYFGT